MTFRRIVVAVAAPGARVAMATAVDLARSLEAELLGLFVEDAELIALAMLPCAGEVGYPAPGRRVLDVEAMERGLRVQARCAERELAALAGGRPLRWSFDVVRGRMPAEIVARAERSDLAVLPRARGAEGSRAMRIYGDASVPLLLVGERTARLSAIAVVPPAETDPAELAKVVAALSPCYGTTVHLVAVTGRAQARNAPHDEMEAKLRERGLHPRIRRARRFEELATLIATESARLVVLLTGPDDRWERLIEALDCPVLLLPGGRGTASRS